MRDSPGQASFSRQDNLVVKVSGAQLAEKDVATQCDAGASSEVRGGRSNEAVACQDVRVLVAEVRESVYA